MAKKVELSVSRKIIAPNKPKVVVSNTAAEQKSGKRGYPIIGEDSNETKYSDKRLAPITDSKAGFVPFGGGEEDVQINKQDKIDEIVVNEVRALIAKASPNARAQIASAALAATQPDFDNQLIVERSVKERWKKEPKNFKGNSTEFILKYYKEFIDSNVLTLPMLRRIDFDLYQSYKTRVSRHPNEEIRLSKKHDLISKEIINLKDDGLEMSKNNSNIPMTPHIKRHNERKRGLTRRNGL